MRFPASLLASRTLGVASLVALGLAAAPRVAASQEMAVPAEVQLPILLKVMTFDRQLRTRVGGEAVVGVLYQGGNRASVTAKDEAMRIIAASSPLAEGIAVRAVALDLDDVSLARVFSIAEGLTHLYVAPLRATDIKDVAARARAAGITTLTGVPRYVEQGLALGVGLRGGRPRILVNVEASRLEGAEMSAELLKLAEIVK